MLRGGLVVWGGLLLAQLLRKKMNRKQVQQSEMKAICLKVLLFMLHLEVQETNE